MDEVLEIFEKTLVAETQNGSKSNFVELYKYDGTSKFDNQEQRRKELLEMQKTSRQTKLDKFRGILELVNAVEEQDLFHQKKKVYYRPNIYVAGFNKTSLSYSNVLMMSEWMVEKPEDFNENWFVVPCPKGVRMLVVANRGVTKCYTKQGHFRFERSTALPGGFYRSTRSSDCCVLDCFYNEKINTMFILDLLAWKNQPMTDGETEFRHFWLVSQLAELPGINVLSKRNQLNFKVLPKVPCAPDSFNKFMMSYPAFTNNSPPLDGLLFYHKRAPYYAGSTPLVGWLYPYMVPEVLGADIKINESFAKEKPDSYVNQHDFIEIFEAKYNKKHNRSRKSSNSMEMGEPDKKEGKPNKKTHSKPKKGEKGTEAETMEAEDLIEISKEEVEVLDKMDTITEATTPGNQGNFTPKAAQEKREGIPENMDTINGKSGPADDKKK
uniref:Snurportin-1 n=1 Tax=Pectinophora gossypiella TaxID=13191 RepID=A0A1E1W629_PECGO